MPAPQSSNTNRLLAWLTVFVFLLAGAPAARQSAGLQDGQQRVTAANEFAGNLATLDLDDSQRSAQFRLLKVRDMVGSPNSVLFAAPDFLLPRQLKACRAAPATVRRLSLVGMVELRI